MCNSEFFARAYAVSIGQGIYCSRSCSGKKGAEKLHATHSQDGKNNHNWKGGISQNNYHYKKIQVERYPEHIKAREKVAYAKKTGKLIEEPCKECGEGKVTAHHEDYSKPLEVIWLCRKCHRQRHDGKY